MTLIIPNEIINDTPADAVPVDTNYKKIQQYINTELIDRNGSVHMTGQLSLVGDPVQDNDAARKAYVDAILPVGMMLPWLGTTAPAGEWHLADGASLSTTQYSELFDKIQYKYGGSGGTFKLPNMAGVVPIGYKASDAYYGVVGHYGGSTKVPVPSHQHQMDHNHPSAATTDETTNHVHPITHNHASFKTAATGGGHAHTGEFTNDALAGGGMWVGRRIADTGTSAAQITPNNGGVHQHDIDTPQYTGDSGSPKTKHKHNFDTPNYVGKTAAYVLEIADPDATNDKSSTDFHAPFVVINYIVRLK